MMSLSNRLIGPQVINEKVVIGDFRADIISDRRAEDIVREVFSEVEVITSVEGNKLIPIISMLKLDERLKRENKQREIESIQKANEAGENGYKKGYQEGLDKGHTEAQKVIENFASLINAATKQRRLLYEDARKNILELIGNRLGVAIENSMLHEQYILNLRLKITVV